MNCRWLLHGGCPRCRSGGCPTISGSPTLACACDGACAASTWLTSSSAAPATPTTRGTSASSVSLPSVKRNTSTSSTSLSPAAAARRQPRPGEAGRLSGRKSPARRGAGPGVARGARLTRGIARLHVLNMALSSQVRCRKARRLDDASRCTANAAAVHPAAQLSHTARLQPQHRATLPCSLALLHCGRRWKPRLASLQCPKFAAWSTATRKTQRSQRQPAENVTGLAIERQRHLTHLAVAPQAPRVLAAPLVEDQHLAVQQLLLHATSKAAQGQRRRDVGHSRR